MWGLTVAGEAFGLSGSNGPLQDQLRKLLLLLSLGLRRQRKMPLVAAKEIWLRGRFNPMGKHLLGPEPSR